MKWKKIGNIIRPDNVNRDWMVTHAMDPTVDYVKDDIYRVYFCGRNKNNQSLIGYAEIDITNPHEILRTPINPVLGLGELGAFDDNGVTASWVINKDNIKYLYYIGWKPRSTTRFSLMTGLAISEDGGETFKRFSRAPILNLTDKEPFSILTAPCVLHQGNKWMMWYVSCEDWIHADLPRYNIKYAESVDGIHWEQAGIVCIDFKSENETALARPCVLFENNIYRMWYSFKDPAIGYRMGYAESENGINWLRMDEQVGIEVSNEGWDSEMIQYPYVFNHKGKKYMFYNGNGYGENGAGLAVLEN
jgi:hypothetical protein